MTDTTLRGTPDALDRLAATRTEVREILQPDDQRGSPGHFPRSATMRALTGGGAMSALALVGFAVLATRPNVAGRLARAVPLVELLRQLGLGRR
jgi:hypothetical protein